MDTWKSHLSHFGHDPDCSYCRANQEARAGMRELESENAKMRALLAAIHKNAVPLAEPGEYRINEVVMDLIRGALKV